MWFRSGALSLISLLVVVAQALPEGTPGTPDAPGGEIPATTIDLPVPSPEPDPAIAQTVPAANVVPEASVSFEMETPVPTGVVTDVDAPDLPDIPATSSETGSLPNQIEPALIATPGMVEVEPHEAALPAVQMASVRFSPIDPMGRSASSVGVLTVIYTDWEPATEWVLVVTFTDFEPVVAGSPIPVATLTLSGTEGAAGELPGLSHGEFRILPSIDGTHGTHGTITLTFLLSVVEPVPGTAYSSSVSATAIHRDDP